MQQMAESPASGAARPAPTAPLLRPKTAWAARRVTPPLLIAAALVALVINASFRLGRLAGIPIWDDVGTFWQASSWVKVFYQQGIPGIIRAYIASPPHAPYSVLLALAGYLIFGIVEWAPYAMSAFQVWAFLCFLNWTTRGHGLISRCFFMILAAALPFVSVGIHESKGDYASAMALAAGAIVTTTEPFWAAGKRRHLFAGVLFALALWTKPSIFAPTILLTVGTLGVSYLAEWVIDRRRPPSNSVVSALARIVLVIAVLNGPHFYLAGRELWNYMMRYQFGKDANVWVLPGGFWQHARYYLTGDGGQLMIGPFLYVLGAPMLLAGALMLARRRRADGIHFAALLSVVAASYLMPTLNPVKSAQFGLDFDTVFGLAGVWTLAYVCGMLNGAPSRWRSGPVLAGVAAALGVCLYRPTFAWHPYSQSSPHRMPLEDRRALSRALFEQVAGRAKNGPARLAILSGVGDISFDLMTLYTAQEGVDLEIRSVQTQNAQDYAPLIGWANVVIAAEPGTNMTLDLFEKPAVHAEALALVESRPEFIRVLRLPAPRTDSLFELFVRRELAMDGFEGVRVLSGMLPLEGPFPQWDTPRVRWGTGSSTTIEPLVPEGRYVLRIMGQTHSQDQVMTLQLDGSEIGVLPFARTHDWEPLELPVNLGPGSHRLTLLYTKSNPGPDASRSVLFRGLSLVPVHAMESNPANYPPDAVRP